MDADFQIEGLAGMEKLLRELGPEVGKKVALNAARAGARVAQKEMQRRAPVGTEEPHPKYGRLRDNIRVATTEKDPPELQVAVHTGQAFWGMWLEFGTTKMPPKPWFSPAFDVSQEAMLRAMGQSLARGIKREAEKLAGTHGTKRKR